MKRLFPLLILIVMFACEPGDLVDLPAAPKRISILSFNQVGQPWYISVAPTSPPSGFYPESMEEAIVKIYDNGVFLEQLTYDTITQLISASGFKSINHSPEVGHTYKITVEDERFPTVTSEYVQPDPVPADIRFEYRNRRIQTFTSATTDPDGHLITTIDTMSVWTFDVTMTFTDPPGENFYDFWIQSALSKEAYDTATIVAGDYLISGEKQFDVDPILEGQTDDSNFAGQQVTFKFTYSISDFTFFGQEPKIPTYFVVSLRSMTGPQYKFVTQVRKAQISDYDPYAQPVTTFTNVENGLGVFGGYTPYSKAFTFDVSSQ